MQSPSCIPKRLPPAARRRAGMPQQFGGEQGGEDDRRRQQTAARTNVTSPRMLRLRARPPADFVSAAAWRRRPRPRTPQLAPSCAARHGAILRALALAPARTRRRTLAPTSEQHAASPTRPPAPSRPRRCSALGRFVALSSLSRGRRRLRPVAGQGRLRATPRVCGRWWRVTLGSHEQAACAQCTRRARRSVRASRRELRCAEPRRAPIDRAQASVRPHRQLPHAAAETLARGWHRRRSWSLIPASATSSSARVGATSGAGASVCCRLCATTVAPPGDVPALVEGGRLPSGLRSSRRARERRKRRYPCARASPTPAPRPPHRRRVRPPAWCCLPCRPRIAAAGCDRDAALGALVALRMRRSCS
jgi:hypothetical protein